jgi:hypothetical protein
MSAGFKAPGDREVHLAKMSEQAERYDEMKVRREE